MEYTKPCFLFIAVVLHITAGEATIDAASQDDDDVLDVGNKRALAWMDKMMSCLTNRTFFQTLVDFGFYGCYCGFGGSGEPVDGVDSCCKTHDECYGATHRSEHGACYTTLAAYFAPYKYTLDKCDTEEASITCATLDKYKWYYPLRKCAVAICKCDSDLARCIAREPFHKQYRFYNRLKCFNKDDDTKEP